MEKDKKVVGNFIIEKYDDEHSKVTVQQNETVILLGNTTVTLDITNLEKTKKLVDELVETLEKANSLLNELTLNNTIKLKVTASTD